MASTGQLTATVFPENATNKNVSWLSSNDNVATVDQNGLVTAQGNGNCYITAKTQDGGKTDIASIRVEGAQSNIPVAGIQLNKYSETISETGVSGGLLGGFITPRNATNKNCTYEVGPFITVERFGPEGGFDFMLVGSINPDGTETETYIKVTTDDGGFTATCAINITPESSNIPVSGISLDKSVISINTGKYQHSATVIATVTPADATDKLVYWESSDLDVAVVSGIGDNQSTGFIQPTKNTGSCLITAKTFDGGFMAACVVAVIFDPYAP